tara:strand:- start:2185 stop:2304 length:120 start_codon:yes stop_codon:yes gene_type:complete
MNEIVEKDGLEQFLEDVPEVKKYIEETERIKGYDEFMKE